MIIIAYCYLDGWMRGGYATRLPMDGWCRYARTAVDGTPVVALYLANKLQVASSMYPATETRPAGLGKKLNLVKLFMTLPIV